MLRNPGLWGHALRPLLLNEVLSLNAQESSIVHRTRRPYPILNEVLSLNAQECHLNDDGHIFVLPQ